MHVVRTTLSEKAYGARILQLYNGTWCQQVASLTERRIAEAHNEKKKAFIQQKKRAFILHGDDAFCQYGLLIMLGGFAKTVYAHDIDLLWDFMLMGRSLSFTGYAANWGKYLCLY